MNNLLSLKFLPKKLPNNNSFSLSRHFCRTSSFHSSSSSKIITPHKPTNTHSHFLSPLQQWRSSSNSGLLSLFSNHAIPKYARFKAPTKAFLGSRLRFLTTRCSKLNKATPPPPPPPPSSTAEGSHCWPDSVLYILIFVNAAVFTMWQFLPQEFMYKHFTLSPDNFDDGRRHTLITYSFSHSDAMSFATNMVGLYIFGRNYGRVFPVLASSRLLVLYQLGALAGAMYYVDEIKDYRKKQENSSMDPLLKQENSSMDPLMGATGTVLTILLFDMVLVPGRIICPTFSVPIGMLWVAYLAGMDFMLSLKGDSPANVAHHVHGAGFIYFIQAGLVWFMTLV